MQLGWLVAVAVAAPFGSAQAAPSADAEGQASKVDADVVAAFHARADALAAQKQYGRALQLRHELVQEWAPGDEKALKALGFVLVGAQWRRDANLVVFDRDLKGDAKAIKKLDQDWVRIQKDLGKAIERVAQAFAAAGTAERAAVYWQRLLRLRPGDAHASAALQLPTFDGHAGTPDELRQLRRGRVIVQAVQYLATVEFAAARVDAQNALLTKAGLAHTCLQSDHFRLCGTLPEDKLRLAIQFAERALLLSRVLIGCESGELFRPKELRNILLVGDKASYHKVLDACTGQFDAERLKFLKESVELAFVDVGGELERLYALTNGGDDLMIDVTARGVVQDAIGLHADGLWEGLGHAACGFLFDRTLSFFVEQQHGNTVTSWVPKPLLPEMAAWREMASESAWAKNDTPTSRLVLLEGYKFSNEERVKAWAMVDYLMHSRPDLLLQLDAVKTKDVRDPLAVEAAFLRATGKDLRVVDDEWRDYWGKGEALRAAMQAAPAGAAADVDGARALAWAIDAVRVAADRPPAGFVVADGPDVAAAHDFVAQLQRWEKDRKDPKKKDLAPPAAPVAIGATVLLERSADVKAAVAGWMAQPVVRDWLLHPGRNLLGCSATRQSLVLDLTAPAVPVARGWPVAWPRLGQRGVPGAIAVGALGPAFAEPLAAAGLAADAQVGMPVTLHFHRAITADEAREVACRLFVGGLDRDGVLVPLQDVDGLAAPGCFAFVPSAPLPNGEVDVRWNLPHGLLQRDEKFPTVSFQVQ